MTREVKITLYKFDELNERAKESARAWWRETVFTDSHDWEYIFEDACRVAEMFGLDIRTRPVKLMSGKTRYEPTIYFSGFWSQGDGACFEGRYEYKEDALARVKEYAPQDAELLRIVETLQDAQAPIVARYEEGIAFDIKHRGHYNHSGCMDFTRLDDIGDEKDGVTDEETVTQCLRDFADWIYDQLKREHEYQTDNEQVDENIRANGYEFTEDGNIA